MRMLMMILPLPVLVKMKVKLIEAQTHADECSVCKACLFDLGSVVLGHGPHEKTGTELSIDAGSFCSMSRIKVRPEMQS